MKTFAEPAREISVVREADVVVAGAVIRVPPAEREKLQQEGAQE